MLIHTVRLLVFVFFLISIDANGEEIPLRHFASHLNQVKNLKISPDGKHLAGTMLYEDQTILVFYESDPIKLIKYLKFRSNDHVSDFQWVNNERVVYERGTKRGGYDDLARYGDLYGINFDGKKSTILFGYNAGEMQTGTRFKKRDNSYAWPEILHILPDDPEHIMIVATPMYRDGDTSAKIQKLNVYSGLLKPVDITPISFANLVTNTTGYPVFASQYNDKGVFEIYIKDKEKRKWNLWEHNFAKELDIIPILMGADDKSIIVSAISEFGTRGIYEIDFASKQINKLYAHQKVSYNSILTDGRSVPIGIKVQPDAYENYFFDSTSDIAKIYKGLSKAFQGEDTTVTSITNDGSKLIVFVNSDVNPGEYFLYDKIKKEAKHLANSKAWIDVSKMSPKTPISLTTRDKLIIHGYLTLPILTKPPHPLVVMPHGGPIGVRDNWDYDDTVQALASRGYAVLQVNFRGSGGYGDEFEEMGYREWDNGIINDIIDATVWSSKRDDIDADRVCIVGASFGAYAAMMGSILNPKLFKCAVGIAGAYDLVLQLEDSDTAKFDKWLSRLKITMGDDEEKLKAISPVNLVDKLQVPVLIIHGEKDERTPIDHALKLIKELKKHNKPHEQLIKSGEGHGFYNEDNLEEMYQKIISFLNRHTQPKKS